MHVDIDQIPENESEIQTTVDEKIIVVLKLKLVKTVNHDIDQWPNENDNEFFHGENIERYYENLVEHVQDFFEDSYFESVKVEEGLKRNGLRFVGMVESETTKFPIT